MIKSGLFCFILDAPTRFLVVASTSLRQMLPTLKFSSSGPLGVRKILARGLISQFTSLSLHYKYLTSCLKMNPLHPGKDESILTDFGRTFPLFWSLQTLLKALLRPSKQIFQWLKSHTSSHCNFLDKKKQILSQISLACLSSTELVAVVHFLIVCWGAKTTTRWGVCSYVDSCCLRFIRIFACWNMK